MDQQDKLHEQDHPVKNTDDAYVQVGKDGEPVMSKDDNKKETERRGFNLKNENIVGRVDNTDNPNFAEQKNEPDISKVDQQEGEMKNGELGGNLNEKAGATK